MNNLPCEQCTQTDNHCCIADIPYDLPIALSMLHFLFFGWNKRHIYNQAS